MSAGEDKYWYNLTTGQVERGFESPAIDRAGPFDTEDEAANAPKLLAERSRAWSEEDAAEDAWGEGAAARTENDETGDSGR